jgi:hypothetical protein
MTEPTLTCPNCRTEIKLTESLAAPLIAAIRRRYETQLAQNEAEVAAREAAVRDQQEQLAQARHRRRRGGKAGSGTRQDRRCRGAEGQAPGGDRPRSPCQRNRRPNRSSPVARRQAGRSTASPGRPDPQATRARRRQARDRFDHRETGAG